MRRPALLLVLVVAGCAPLHGRVPEPKPPAPVPAPAPPPAAAAPAPAPLPPPAPTEPTSPTPAPPLTPSLPTQQEQRLRADAEKRVDEADQRLRQLAARPLTPRDQESLALAHSLLDQARKALGVHEYERAANLATKARTLATDLGATPR
jgi:hypothetical protein